MAHDVFISHSSKDKPTADAVCAVLESHGIRCWVAPRDVTPGMEFAESIIEAINASRIMVLMFSSHANQSPQVRREVERAVNKAVVIIPVRIEDIVPTGSMEYYLSTPHWLDAFSPPLQKHFDKLIDTIKAVSADRVEPSPNRSGVEAAARPAAIPYSHAASPWTPATPVPWGVKNFKAILVCAIGIVAICLLTSVVILVRTKAVGVTPTVSKTIARQGEDPLVRLLGITQSVLDEMNLTDVQKSKLQDVARAVHDSDMARQNASGSNGASNSSFATIQKGRERAHQQALAVLTDAQKAIVLKYVSANPPGPPPGEGGSGSGASQDGGQPPSGGQGFSGGGQGNGGGQPPSGGSQGNGGGQPPSGGGQGNGGGQPPSSGGQGFGGSGQPPSGGGQGLGGGGQPPSGGGQGNGGGQPSSGGGQGFGGGGQPPSGGGQGFGGGGQPPSGGGQPPK